MRACSTGRFTLLGAAALGLAAVLLGAGPVRADATNEQEVLRAFRAHVANMPDVPDERRQAALRLLDEQAKVPADLAEALAGALAMLYDTLAGALGELSEERFDQALPALGRLGAWADPYLAAQARFLLGRTLVYQERFELALPHLAAVLDQYARHTLHGGQALFLLAVAQAGTLDRPAALASLERFLAEHPAAPERLRVGARTLQRQLQAVQEGALTDVAARMDFSRRRLADVDTGRRTQIEQQRIIDMLDKLIEQARKDEQGGSGGAGGGSGSSAPARGAGSPSSPAQQSVAPEGAAQVGGLHGMRRDRADWGDPRDRQRQEVIDALKERFPQRYQDLIEQYYRSLQEDPTP